jgi:site-specific recombinase XerD
MKTLPLQTTYYEYLLQSYQEWLQTIGYADPTVNNWPAHVRELLHYLESKSILHITLVTSYHLKDFIYYIKYRRNTARPGALSSSSINTIINATNSFARYLNSTGKYVLDITLERMDDNTGIPTVLSVQEVKCLYEATFLPQRENNIAMGQRDRAIIAVFYGCGLRKMEGTQLNITDIDLQKRLLFVAKGKGNKQRHVPIAHKHAEDIRSYLEEGREWFLYEHYAKDYTSKYAKKKAPDTGAFFIGQHGERLQRFYQRLEYLKEKAGIEKQFGLHTLRHSIATHLAMSGMPIEEIARFLGHSSLDSTQIYVHLSHELKNKDNG